MASEVDICNLALGLIGDEANVSSIDPPDSTVQALQCSRFYALARNQLLERHSWGFATKRVALSLHATATTDVWKYQYAKPSDMLKPLAVLLGAYTDDENRQDYIIEGDRILTNVENAVLKYTAVITDTTKYTPLFIEALAHLLASRIVGPIVKGSTGMKLASEMKKLAEKTFLEAAASDANNQNNQTAHVPSWLSARGTDVRDAKHATAWRR